MLSIKLGRLKFPPFQNAVFCDEAIITLTAELLQSQLQVRDADTEMDEWGHVRRAILPFEQEEVLSQCVPMRSQRESVVAIQ